MDACNWTCELLDLWITTLKQKSALNRNICQINLIYAIYGCISSSKK